MAKKRQTTGLPKTGSTNPTPAAKEGQTPDPKRGGQVKQYQSRAEREAQLQRNIIRVTAVVLAVVAIGIIGSFLYEFLYRPNQAVANVNGENITVGQFQERLRIENTIIDIQFSNSLLQFAQFMGGDFDQAYQQLTQQEPYATWASELQFPDTLANRVLNEMIDDKLVEAEAAKMGITVTDEDIQEQMNEFIGYDPEEVANIGVEPTITPTETITPTPYVSPTPSLVPTITPLPTNTPTNTALPEGEASPTPGLTTTAVDTATPEPTLSVTEVQGNFQTRRESLYERLGRSAGASQAAVDNYFRAKALRKKVGEAISTSVTEGKTLYVNSRHILVATIEEAQDVISALQSGESFADLARAISSDTGSGAQGGELGWTPTFQFVDPFADAVTTAAIGEIVGPIESEFGFHIIQVRAREQRELEEAQIDQVNERDFQAWLSDLKTSESVRIETYDTWTNNVPNLPGITLEGF